MIAALSTTAIVIEMCLRSPCFNTEDDYEISSGIINQLKDVITCFSCWNGCLITALRRFFHLVSSLIPNAFCDLEDQKEKEKEKPPHTSSKYSFMFIIESVGRLHGNQVAF